MSEALRDAQRIIPAAIEAVLPDAAVRRALKDYKAVKPVTIIAIGKAAWRMARAAYDALGAAQVKQGIVLTKYEHCEGPIGCLQLREAGHPVPDENGAAAAREIITLAESLKEEDEVLVLISGGGSALFECPAEGLTLSDIAEITGQLLACGADITEMNCIRKRLSRVKGGRLAQLIAPAHLYSIILSDVLGDPLDAIASGPTVPDLTDCAMAADIVSRYHISCTPAVLAALAAETPKKLPNAETFIAGNVQALCEAAAREAEALGYAAKIMDMGVCMEARKLGVLMAAEAVKAEPGTALIWGGETIVHLVGKGKGGRNQEAALSAAPGIAGLRDVCVFGLGSDGTDGPTDAAGGIVTGSFLSDVGASAIEAHLANNDAYPLLRDHAALIMTGPTGTNVNDLYMVLIK